MLARLNDLGIPVVLNTSKTRAELRPIAAELGLDAHLVVENGSALYPSRAAPPRPPPGLERLVLGCPYHRVLARLGELRPRFRFSEIAARTGLDPARAERAGRREFSEPLQWEDEPSRLPSFERALRRHGLRTLRGGRFLHVLGDTDKGRALTPLINWMTAACGRRPRLICLGDSDNDLAMLERADIAVRVSAPGRPLPCPRGAARLITTDQPGPLGWAGAMQKLLDELFGPANRCNRPAHGS